MARTELAASNFAGWFSGVLGRKFPTWGTLLPQAPKIGQIGARQQVLPIDNCSPSTDGALSGSGGDWRLSAILALGMCGYMAVPADRRTC